MPTTIGTGIHFASLPNLINIDALWNITLLNNTATKLFYNHINAPMVQSEYNKWLEYISTIFKPS